MLRVRTVRYEECRHDRHAHDETTVTIVLAGSLRERVGGAEEIARALSIVVKPGGTEHANEFSRGVRTLQIAAARDTMSARPDADACFDRWRWYHGGPAVPAFLRLARAHRRSAEQPSALHDAALETATFDALAAIGEWPIGVPPGLPPDWLRRVRERLDDETSPPRVRAIARDAGVHPVYVARQFRRWYGLSITEAWRRRRVQRAAGAIAASPTRLSLVAVEAGFSDHAHLCRLFARETGCTPAAYRRLVAG